MLIRSFSKESKIKLEIIQGHLERNWRDDNHNEKNTHQSSLFQSIQTDYSIQNFLKVESYLPVESSARVNQGKVMMP